MILGIDQGTTGTTAIIYDEYLQPLSQGYATVTRYQPEPGLVEVTPHDLFKSIEQAVAEALSESNLKPADIEAVGLANQGETAMCWDADGQPLHNALVWQDRRTADRCEELAADEELVQYIRETTGLRIDSYFSATKLEWLLEHVDVPEAVFIGTTDTWLLWKLVEGDPYVTDHATASRTMLFNIQELEWDERLLQIFGLDSVELPKVQSTDTIIGTVATERLGEINAPVAGCIVDQQAALYGQGCHKPGDVKCTYGTGSFLLMNAGTEPVQYESGVLGTVGWTLGGETTYAYDGGIYTTGAFIDWLVESLELIDSPAETEELAREAGGTNGVLAIPALTGLAAPYWDPNTRGAFLGLDSSTTRAHIVRAGLEGIAHRVRDVVQAMQDGVGTELETLQVDGGLTANRFLLEYQGAVLDQPISISAVSEATSLGTAALAGQAVGLSVDTDRLGENRSLVEPGDFDYDVTAQYEDWHRALETLRNWHHTR